jgi:hypothetical protein
MGLHHHATPTNPPTNPQPAFNQPQTTPNQPPPTSYAPIPATSLAKLADCKEQLVDLLHRWAVRGVIRGVIWG